MLSDEWLSRYELLKNLHIKLCRSVTGTRTRTDADNQGDYNSSPCTSYRRAKKAWLSADLKIIVTFLETRPGFRLMNQALIFGMALGQITLKQHLR